VGDVGGVAEKTVAVQRAGATIFFVPDVEVSTARSAAGPGLRIVGVSSLHQVLTDLHRLGGASPVPLTKPH
jgi:PDZ domain-containing protein